MLITKLVTIYIDLKMRFEIKAIKWLKKDLQAMKKFMDLD